VGETGLIKVEVGSSDLSPISHHMMIIY